MAFRSGQKRLNTIFGAQEELCLQVFVIVLESYVSPDKFESLTKQHEVDFSGDDYIKYLPKPKVGSIDFRPGFLMIDSDGDKKVRDAKVQAVFTSVDRTLINQIQSAYAGVNHVCFSNDVLDRVMSEYTKVFEKEIPEMDFEDKRYCDLDNLSVEFQFGIQPYNFNLHPPRDMDILKPITVIDGHVIEPAMTRIDDFGLRDQSATTGAMSLKK